MNMSFKKYTILAGEFLLGLGVLAAISANVSATEYRLFVNDTAACRSAGISGSVCLVPVGASAAPVTSTTTVASTTATTRSSGDCVVTTWNNCGGVTTGSTTTTAAIPTTSTVPVTSSTTTVSSSNVANVASGSVAGGNLDYGSGGGNANNRTSALSVTNETIAYPFTVTPGTWHGRVGIVPTSAAFPDDGTRVRMWWSSTAGGSALSNACAGNLGREGGLWWDQSGKLGYGCAIPNTAATLYLNIRACVSAANDLTCGAAGASPGSAAPVYISGAKGLL